MRGTLAYVIEANHLDVSFDTTPLSKRRSLDVRAIFGSHSDFNAVYNTPRAWYMLKTLNPHTFNGQPEDMDLPWCMTPEKKVTIEDIKYVLSSYYQHTEFNPYERFGDTKNQGKYRPIGINRNNFVAITQIRPYVPFEIQCVEWIAQGCNAFNGIIPFYTNVNNTPAYLRDTNELVTTESFYWANRLIGTLVDAHYSSCIGAIDQYAMKCLSMGHSFLSKFDKEFMNSTKEDVQLYLETCNQQIADFIKKETYDVLDTVLKISGNEMKNRYTRGDA